MVHEEKQANSMSSQTCKDRPCVSLNMDINKIWTSRDNTQENKMKCSTKMLHNTYNAEFRNNDNDKRRGRPAGEMSREHNSFETQQSNRSM